LSALRAALRDLIKNWLTFFLTIAMQMQHFLETFFKIKPFFPFVLIISKLKLILNIIYFICANSKRDGFQNEN
jgi:hypothetical protein